MGGREADRCPAKPLQIPFPSSDKGSVHHGEKDPSSGHDERVDPGRDSWRKETWKRSTRPSS